MLDPNRSLYRWGPISACPLFMYFNIEPAFAPLKKLLGICYPESTIMFYDKKVLWLLDNEGFGLQSKKFTDKNILPKPARSRYFYLWNQQNAALHSLFKRLDTLKFDILSKDKLVSLYQDFSKIYYDWFTVTISLELATVTLEPLLGAKLKSYFRTTEAKEYTRAFSILTSPLVLTFYRKEQRDLLSILTLPRSKQEKALKNHQSRYYWMYNSYFEGKVLDISFFKSELRKAQRTDYEKILKEISEYPETTKKQKEDIFARIRPNEEFLDLVSLVETFITLQDERKMYNFMAEHYLELFVEAYSNKTHIGKNLLKLLILDELPESLTIPNNKLLHNRQTAFVMNCNANEITHYDGSNALMIVNQYLGVRNINQNVIQGTVASIGAQNHFRGTAKIVHTIKEIGKIHKGDILVTTMTSPDYVIGMKKAGAVITDTGGILSHAAIVSRELKIPCIVGTEIATKVIQDGDVVELHCGKGTVKIVKYKT